MIKSRKIQVITKSYLSSPILETAISKTILDQSSSNMFRETLRFFEARNLVAFSVRDSREIGFINAVNTTYQNLFDPVLSF